MVLKLSFIHGFEIILFPWFQNHLFHGFEIILIHGFEIILYSWFGNHPFPWFEIILYSWFGNHLFPWFWNYPFFHVTLAYCHLTLIYPKIAVCLLHLLHMFMYKCILDHFFAIKQILWALIIREQSDLGAHIVYKIGYLKESRMILAGKD